MSYSLDSEQNTSKLFNTKEIAGTNELALLEYYGDETEVYIPLQVDGKPITTLGEIYTEADFSVFFHNKMERLVIPKTVLKIEAGIIFKCHDLTYIEVDEDNPVYKSIEGVVFTKDEQSLVLFPSGRKGTYILPQNTKVIQTGAFFNSTIKEVVCNSRNFEHINEIAFLQSEYLEEVALLCNAKINSTAFLACFRLRSLIQLNDITFFYRGLFDGVLYDLDYSDKKAVCFYPAGKVEAGTGGVIKFLSDIKKVDDYAFAYCRNLTIVLPVGLESLGKAAFMGCQNIEIIAYGNISKIGEDCFTYSKGIKIQTQNYKVKQEAEKAGIIVQSIEGEFKLKTKKLTKLEHAAFMSDLAREKLEEPIEDAAANSTRNANQLKRNEAIRNFPWGETVNEEAFEADLSHVKFLMDKELYKLEGAKRQVLRSLAICMRNPNAPLRPLLLIGPAGTGKTSFARVISEAMGRSLKRISMPSLTAAWQFTGTEKSYGTAGCGIIIQSIIDAGEFPVFLFDEVDKADGVGGQYASVQHGLLNLLDDSRSSFRDEFFEIPVDLQNAFFILTANEEVKVNKFVMDRCRVIYIEGYKNIDDRRLILKDFMLPKIYKDYNLTTDEYELTDEVIDLILAESKDENGGLRILQMQAEVVLQEVILRMNMESRENGSFSEMSCEAVKKVLAELSKRDSAKRILGFSNRM